MGLLISGCLMDKVPGKINLFLNFPSFYRQEISLHHDVAIDIFHHCDGIGIGSVRFTPHEALWELAQKLNFGLK